MVGHPGAPSKLGKKPRAVWTRGEDVCGTEVGYNLSFCTALHHHPIHHCTLPFISRRWIPHYEGKLHFRELILQSMLQLRVGGTVDLHRHLVPTILLRARGCGSGTRYRCPTRLFLGSA